MNKIYRILHNGMLRITNPFRRIPYYSDSLMGQDKWITNIVYPGKKDGFFIDLGSSNGILINNTYTLEKVGWTGICIEPQIDLYNKLKKNRKSICINACISNKKEIIDFVNSEHHGGILKFLKSYKKYDEKNWKNGKIVKMQTTTMRDILKKLNVPKNIDYMSIDVECSEYAILSSFPFLEYNVGAITVEGSNIKKIVEVLTQNGFTLVENPYCKLKFELHFINSKLIGKI